MTMSIDEDDYPDDDGGDVSSYVGHAEIPYVDDGSAPRLAVYVTISLCL